MDLIQQIEFICSAFLFVALFLVFAASNESRAFTILGTGSESLVGGDLTDVDDIHDEGTYNPPADFGGFDAEFFSSDEPGFGHQFEVPGDARLALSQYLGEILDVQLRARQQRQNAQARGLARTTEHGKGLVAA